MKASVPRKVLAFSCGGGSFFEYEQVKNLNDEKCNPAGSQASNENGNASTSTAGGVSAASQSG